MTFQSPPASLADLIEQIETLQSEEARAFAASALGIVRDGVITGEGPTTKGRIHFSRSLDADDAAWCARILTAAGISDKPVSRAEAETLFQINEAAADRTDDGAFDDLLAKAVVHHAASASGLPVPPRAIALAPETDIDSWAPKAVGVSIEVLEWLATQMRGKRRGNSMLKTMIAASLVGVATLQVVQTLPNFIEGGF